MPDENNEMTVEADPSDNIPPEWEWVYRTRMNTVHQVSFTFCVILRERATKRRQARELKSAEFTWKQMMGVPAVDVREMKARVLRHYRLDLQAEHDEAQRRLVHLEDRNL